MVFFGPFKIQTYFPGRELRLKTNKLHASIPLMLASSFVFAIGMGDIRVESFINQPFSAEIPLLDLGSNQLSAIKASLATAEEFERIGVEKPVSVLPLLKFDVVKTRDGYPVIKISTSERVSEPYLQILVDLAWPDGQIYRNYTVLLDPPGYKLSAASKNDATQTSYRKSASNGYEYASAVQKDGYIAAMTKPATPEVQKETIVYGPTRARENIWQISQRYSSPEMAIQQIILAIVGTNSQAFTQGNLNGLKPGERLRIPFGDEVHHIPLELARQEVDAHDLAWKSRQEIKHVLLPPYVDGVAGVSQFNQVADADSDSLPSIIAQAPRLELPLAQTNVSFESEKNTMMVVSNVPSIIDASTIAAQSPATAVDNADHVLLKKQLQDLQEKNNQLEKALSEKSNNKAADLQMGSPAKFPENQTARINENVPAADKKSSGFWLYALLIGGLGAGALIYRMQPERCKKSQHDTDSMDNHLHQADDKPPVHQVVLLENEEKCDSAGEHQCSELNVEERMPKLIKSKAALDTMLTLTKTHIDMEYYERAKFALHELLVFGDEHQKREAQTLMEELDSK